MWSPSRSVRTPRFMTRGKAIRANPRDKVRTPNAGASRLTQPKTPGPKPPKRPIYWNGLYAVTLAFLVVCISALIGEGGHFQSVSNGFYVLLGIFVRELMDGDGKKQPEKSKEDPDE